MAGMCMAGWPLVARKTCKLCLTETCYDDAFQTIPRSSNSGGRAGSCNLRPVPRLQVLRKWDAGVLHVLLVPLCSPPSLTRALICWYTPKPLVFTCIRTENPAGNRRCRNVAKVDTPPRSAGWSC